jgi:hypothetical protein
MINLKEYKPFIIDNVLSDEDYSYVYDCVNNSFPEEIKPDLPPDNRQHPEYLNVPDLGYFAYIKGFKPEFYDAVREATEKATGLSLLRPQIHFARYTNKTGSKPLLRPHNDNQLINPSITLSIQLDSTLDWELCAYDTCDTLAKNQAMVFSGSHQIHWRPVKDFNDDDYLDIMVCQLPINTEKLDDQHRAEMDKLRDAQLEKFFMEFPSYVDKP